MPDRHSGYVISLENDIRDDEAEEIITALKMVKGVVSVQPVTAGKNVNEIIAATRNNYAWREKLIELLQEMQ